MNNCKYYIGLMSGTSADGVDVSIVKIKTSAAKKTLSCELIEFLTTQFPEKLISQLHKLNTVPQVQLVQLAHLQLDVAQEFAKAVNLILKKSNIKSSDISAIGSHGQTIYHAPKLTKNLGMSIQIGHPAVIAKLTQITTVADFRVDDMAMGGQGAPLAPAFHKIIFKKQIQNNPIAVVNIGGVSNISLISTDKVYGYDIGPGNCLMDEICKQYFSCNFDDNGKIASRGKVDNILLKELKQHSFFQKKSPKSTGRDSFNTLWLQKFKLPKKPEDLLATLNMLTADTIIDSLSTSQFITGIIPSTLYICGGGTLNGTLMQTLKNLSKIPVHSTHEIGINSEAIEAMLCAWLAQQRLVEQPIKIASITGASKDSILGGIYLP